MAQASKWGRLRPSGRTRADRQHHRSGAGAPPVV